MTSCDTCRHATPTVADNDDDLLLHCRRYPPTVIVINDDDVAQTWPTMRSTDTCGEWASGTTQTDGAVWLPTAHGTLPRIDAIGLDGRVYVGTPAANPVPPSLPSAVVIAHVRVGPQTEGAWRLIADRTEWQKP
jgi:hypothetical protein